jgi:hypothetical protein
MVAAGAVVKQWTKPNHQLDGAERGFISILVVHGILSAWSSPPIAGWAARRSVNSAR